MIDTIIMTIEQEKYKILDYKKFGITEKGLAETDNGFKKFINNPTAKDKVSGIYKPRLTLIKRFNGIEFVYPLKIEFSAPKLVLGNNLEEVGEDDFDCVVKIFKQRILSMGVLVSEKNIQGASISAFHPSKNIVLSSGYTATAVIKEFAKVNLSKKLDLSKTDFRNNGQLLHYYANSHSFVMYDKIADILKPPKRAIDKERTTRELQFVKELKDKKIHIEILKMEVRLSNKRKMNSVLREIGYPENPNFSNIFNKDLCQKIILFYWNNFIAEKNLFLFDKNNNPQNILKAILKENPQVKIKESIYLLGLNILSKDAGIRELRDIIQTYRPATNWSRIKKDLLFFNQPYFCQYQHEFIKDIQKSLHSFVPLRVKL